ncbi:hypothetical protein SGLAD_v1c03960 [Spiroplasma gladiatoris]|uniref:Lipoprotein n=1 Tax=Spiroplasma gladiatoris TaxID=2143 RepID=A0A4P7AGR3_9MOLU|nr:hypothetical protein [Spiroplasma gladiatoris]QBQ07595.1 hypothetical protein SGLAD_v1c03960 [Spiroplasma gladiatoris]
MKKLLFFINSIWISFFSVSSLSGCFPNNYNQSETKKKWDINETSIQKIKQGLKKQEIEKLITNSLNDAVWSFNNYLVNINTDFYIQFFNSNNLNKEIIYKDLDIIYGQTTIIVKASESSKFLTSQKNIYIDKIDISKFNKMNTEAGYKIDFYLKKIKEIIELENEKIIIDLNADYKINYSENDSKSIKIGQKIFVNAVDSSKVLYGSFEWNVIAYDPLRSDSVFKTKNDSNFNFTLEYEPKNNDEFFKNLEDSLEKIFFKDFVFKNKIDFIYRYEDKDWDFEEGYKIITGIFVLFQKDSDYIKYTEEEIKLPLTYSE